MHGHPPSVPHVGLNFAGNFLRFRLQRFSHVKLKFHGTDTDIDTDIRMRLSCNFVNVYTIVYHVQYTYTCTCLSLIHISEPTRPY